jgi:hypothetical protein
MVTAARSLLDGHSRNRHDRDGRHEEAIDSSAVLGGTLASAFLAPEEIHHRGPNASRSYHCGRYSVKRKNAPTPSARCTANSCRLRCGGEVLLRSGAPRLKTDRVDTTTR